MFRYRRAFFGFWVRVRVGFLFCFPNIGKSGRALVRNTVSVITRGEGTWQKVLFKEEE